MPAGSTLDYFVYHDRSDDHFHQFMILRLVCSVLAAGLLALHYRDWQAHNYRLWGFPVHRVLGLPIALLPAFFISWMIYASEGIYSPYYAGLNLIVLAVSVVVRWDVRESVFAVLGVALMYVAACALHFSQHDNGMVKPDTLKLIYNNSYFIVLTGIIVVAGNYYFNKLRQELGRVRDQLAQAEKMASLGQMSAGVIHEINNPLNYATSGLFALRKQSKYIAEERRLDYEETVGDVQDGINRVNNIVSNLRIFTHPMFMRPDPSALEEVSAAEIVNDAIRGVSHLAREPIRIVNNVAADQLVRADRQRLVQVVENLVRNSLDALATKPAGDEVPTVRIESRADKDSFAIAIRDNGPGIKPADLARVFDPFFTTKDVGKGMGLGLTVCQGIMQACGGNISVRSESGRFCEFLLEFPSKA
jgi:two-component system sensor histidine kinase PhcS